MQLLSSLTATLFAVVVSAHASTQASNFAVSAKTAERYSCGHVCQTTLNKTNAADLEIFDTRFDFDFYATATNFSSSSSPGSLLKLKPLNGTALTVPAGVSVYKFQYTSQDINGTTVPATGFIAFPFVRHKAHPFKLVAFAHGTSGIFHGCAPSTSSFLYDYDSWTPLLLSGYAIVATDYAGLGNDMSVAAAHKAFPHDLTREWVSIGHSQGGGAVYKLSEHKLVQNSSSGYLGGVSIAPITKLYDSIVDAFTSLGNSDKGGNSFGTIGSVVLGIQAVFPHYTAPFLAKTMRKRIQLAKLGQDCDVSMSGLVSDLSISDIVGDITSTDIKVFQGFQKINAPAQGDKASKPLLLIQSKNDTIISESVVLKSYKDSCAAGNPVRLSIYPGLDHSATVGASAPEWLSFIKDLFASTVSMCGCVNETVIPFNLKHAAAPLDSAPLKSP